MYKTYFQESLETQALDTATQQEKTNKIGFL